MNVAEACQPPNKQTPGRVRSAQRTDIKHLTMLTLALPPLGTESQHTLYKITLFQASAFPIQWVQFSRAGLVHSRG